MSTQDLRGSNGRGYYHLGQLVTVPPSGSSSFLGKKKEPQERRLGIVVGLLEPEKKGKEKQVVVILNENQRACSSAANVLDGKMKILPVSEVRYAEENDPEYRIKQQRQAEDAKELEKAALAEESKSEELQRYLDRQSTPTAYALLSPPSTTGVTTPVSSPAVEQHLYPPINSSLINPQQDFNPMDRYLDSRRAATLSPSRATTVNAPITHFDGYAATQQNLYLPPARQPSAPPAPSSYYAPSAPPEPSSYYAPSAPPTTSSHYDAPSASSYPALTNGSLPTTEKNTLHILGLINRISSASGQNRVDLKPEQRLVASTFADVIAEIVALRGVDPLSITSAYATKTQDSNPKPTANMTLLCFCTSNGEIAAEIRISVQYEGGKYSVISVGANQCETKSNGLKVETITKNNSLGFLIEATNARSNSIKLTLMTADRKPFILRGEITAQLGGERPFLHFGACPLKIDIRANTATSDTRTSASDLFHDYLAQKNPEQVCSSAAKDPSSPLHELAKDAQKLAKDINLFKKANQLLANFVDQNLAEALGLRYNQKSFDVIEAIFSFKDFLPSDGYAIEAHFDSAEIAMTKKFHLLNATAMDLQKDPSASTL